jgi:hypothetical protein
MADSASPVQQGLTIIEIRPYRNGWECFEAPGVQAYWTGPDAKQSAIDYASARAKFGQGEIRVLKAIGAENACSSFWNVDGYLQNCSYLRSHIPQLFDISSSKSIQWRRGELNPCVNANPSRPGTSMGRKRP